VFNVGTTHKKIPHTIENEEIKKQIEEN